MDRVTSNMAELPRSDLETDDVPQLRRLRAKDSKPSTCDELVDSGVGYSLNSSDYGSLSIEGVREYFSCEHGRLPQKPIENFHPNYHTSTYSNNLSVLHKQFRDMSVGNSEHAKDSVRSSGRYDSGIDSGNFSVEDQCYIEVGFNECTSVSSIGIPAFSQQELDELFSQDEDGDTHLHMSIIHLLPEVSLKIIALAPHSDFINIPNNMHQTPLHLAVATQQLLVARWLMVAGASLDAPDYNGNTPLHIACREGMFDMLQFLMTPIQHQDTLANSYCSHIHCTPQDLSIRNYDGYTCTHLALMGGHLNILQTLLAKGANVNEQDGKSGRTLLHMAADLGYMEALQLLVPHARLNLNARTYGGLTAVSLAHGRRLNTIVNYLYHAGADCTHLSQEDSGAESSDEEMNDYVYDDICINGQPVHLN